LIVFVGVGRGVLEVGVGLGWAVGLAACVGAPAAEVVLPAGCEVLLWRRPADGLADPDGLADWLGLGDPAGLVKPGPVGVAALACVTAVVPAM